MWKRLKAIVRKPLQGLIGLPEDQPTRWESAQLALRRAQANRQKRQQEPGEPMHR